MYKILIVEDELDIRENIQQILELKDFTAITAENGWEGLQMAQKHQPDLIVCDIMMPLLDGYGLLKTLRQDVATASIPFIFLTAKAEHADLRQAMKLGADDYLTKPFQLDKLLQVISTQLEKRQIVTQQYKGKIEQMEAQVNHLARHDNLSNLPNQLFLEEYFNQTRLQVYNEDGQFLPLLLLDINILYQSKLLFEPSLRHFLCKNIGERLNNLKQNNQAIDLIAYLETNQLALLLKPTQDSKLVAEIAQQILESLSQPISLNDQQIFVQTRIGISCYPNDGLQLNELLTYAEITLEHYKLDKTNCYHFYHQEILNVIFRKVLLECDFLSAIENKEFELYYQPQINTKTGKTIGVEALIRWHHPEHGLISPAEFIPIAEQSGFIVPLGEWILKTACLQIKNLELEEVENFKLAVNISAYQFQQENFSQRVLEIIEETNFDMKQLELELTETVFIQDLEAVKLKMKELKSQGIELSIDDFGTGYSSFKYLREFSFNNLKVDRYFITNIDKLRDKQSIVKVIIQMAHDLMINIIAEGVETQEELNWLKQNHCDVIQGYFFSRPLPIENLKIFLLAEHQK
ncbi:EAL domain-containing protein [Dolichospermum sp. ST_con]|nr:EAL domain-containing protein [Dolichospermum sp. ST_con]MDD1421801.1 EAL domain-containing protein [Dolichospermum sp. ST_sed1]MDD1425995.1 EAL domain-containing protein [Dolichospermum sp. ST_sed9]MDD1430181.1 EAL domain-containing protein [Dolichospermum sp. ST_sed6]MDD1442288.1 EAL domain-containing protein [Dolichospermum sp. ST_sed3]MDD1447525.1 EAL domain-containing protein [Dolichospermum sp. ST_sed8]MDD1457381.1 EAL domain-containing protein [Dolichospermum sp. ST_sed7]MDD1459055